MTCTSALYQFKSLPLVGAHAWSQDIERLVRDVPGKIEADSLNFYSGKLSEKDNRMIEIVAPTGNGHFSDQLSELLEKTIRIEDRIRTPLFMPYQNLITLPLHFDAEKQGLVIPATPEIMEHFLVRYAMLSHWYQHEVEKMAEMHKKMAEAKH